METMSESGLPRIEPATLQLVPEKIVRAFSVLPFCSDEGSITLYCPDEPAYPLENEESLRFALNRSIAWLPIPRKLLESEIDRYYPGTIPEIRNCNVRFRFNCPRTWTSLTPTQDQNQRKCEECDRIVYRCFTDTEANWLGKQGKCVALVTSDEDELLGEIDGTDWAVR
jgi:hypothetical protein